MRKWYSDRCRYGKRTAHPRHHLNRYSRTADSFKFFSTPSEQERIAPFEPDHLHSLLRTVNDYTTKYFAESDKIQADADAFFVKAKGILDVVSLPLPNVCIKESFSFTFPYLNQVVEIKTSDWPIIGVFRTFMKWIMALLSFWIAFVMINRTFGRV